VNVRSAPLAAWVVTFALFPATVSAQTDAALEAGASAEGRQGPPARVFGRVRGLLGVDTRFESRPADAAPENVMELRGQANLGVDVKWSERLRVFLEGRVSWRGTARPGFEHAKALFEPLLGEAFVDLYSPGVDLRVGNQLLPLGANLAFAPSDALNPRDLREGFLQGEPEDARLPIFAVRARGEVFGFEWMAAYVPFFEPDRYTLWGQDESLLQPGLGGGVPPALDASIEDALQPHLLETKRPRAFPWLGDVALRLTRQVEHVRLGASWVWMNEKLPEVRVDPELGALVAGIGRGSNPSQATLLSVQNRLRAGESLYSGSYARQHLFSLEASRVVGPAQVDLDVSYSPRQTFYGDDFSPQRKAAWTWVLGITQAEDSPWLYNLTYVGLAVPGVDAETLLALIEPATARGAVRTAVFHAFILNLSRRFWEDRLEVGVRAAFEPLQRSYAVGPRVTYRVGRWTVFLAAEFFEGSAYSPFGYFGRNDQVLSGVQADLF